MAFIEQRFPEGIAQNASGGPVWSTAKGKTSGGKRTTNRRWLYPKHRFKFAMPGRAGAEFEQLRAWFYITGGAADGFRWRDYSDYVCTRDNSSLTPIAGSQWQLNRVYSVGAFTFERPIVKPVAGVVVYRTRASVETVASDATVDVTTGVVTFTGHQAGDTYTWAGEFDIPVAFTSDEAVFMLLGTPIKWTEWSDLEVEEI